MKQLSRILLLTSALTLSACGEAGQQWIDPDKTFAIFEQPKVKGVNETQEEMAKEAVTAGDFNRAGQFYQQLVASQKGTPEDILRYKMGLAEATRRTGDTNASLAMYEELNRENPNNAEIMEGRALSLMANGKTIDAGRAFADVMEKDPKRWRTLNALGILFTAKNMVPEAIAYYTEALEASPDNIAVLNNVGLSYAADKQYSRAIEALQHASRATTIPTRRKQVEMNLAMVQGISGDMDSARATAGKYIEGPALDNNLGLYAHLAKDDNLAKTYLNMALTQSPTFYQRAWENLDVVNDAARTDDTVEQKGKPVGSAKLPALDALSQPEVKKAKPVAKMKKPAAPASAPAEEVEAAIPVPVTNTPETKPEPAAKADERKLEEKKAEEKKREEKKTGEKKPAEKPAGLIIGPGEGD